MDLELAAGMGRIDLMPSFFNLEGDLLPSAGHHHPPVNVTVLSETPANELLEQALVYAVIGEFKSKNDFVLEMIEAFPAEKDELVYVLMDSWYTSEKVINACNRKGDFMSLPL